MLKDTNTRILRKLAQNQQKQTNKKEYQKAYNIAKQTLTNLTKLQIIN